MFFSYRKIIICIKNEHICKVKKVQYDQIADEKSNYIKNDKSNIEKE